MVKLHVKIMSFNITDTKIKMYACIIVNAVFVVVGSSLYSELVLVRLKLLYWHADSLLTIPCSIKQDEVYTDVFCDVFIMKLHIYTSQST